MIKDLLKETEEKMKRTEQNLTQEFATIRTSKATPTLLDVVKVSYYDNPTPLRQLASVSVPEPTLLIVKPWDKSIMEEVKKGILKAELGLVPSVDGEVLKISIPPLSEERRQELKKIVKKIAEEAKISIRNERRECKEDIEEVKKEGIVSEDDFQKSLKQLQELTDNYTQKIDTHLEHKTKEIEEE